jgi:two-component system, OmpR family, sensor histidine kinase MprB
MALKRRVGLAAAAAVGVAVVLAACVCYLVVRGQLRSNLDGSLRAEAAEVVNSPLNAATDLPYVPPSAGGPAPYVQVVVGNKVYGSTGRLALPVTSATVAAAAGHGGMFMSDVTVDGSDLREITVPVTFQQGFQRFPAALQLARPLGGIDSILSNLRLVLLALCALGIGLAAFLGRFAARRVLAPLAEVADTAQQIGETDDLSLRLRIHADDEVGQLARNFNAMLARLEGSRAALDESVRAQRQLVADASHELRTPVTSLRTNIEVLLAGAELDDEDRRRLLADVVEQSEELTALVNDLIELARGDQPYGDADDVRLDRVVDESLVRARRNAPSVEFEARLEPVIVDGVPERLERAVNNLLDNAARHSPPGGTVEVTVGPGGVRVRDHGTGVEPAELPYVFDRFFRGANSRGSQGSGLGLAIVRQVAEQHGGHASAENAPDGGAVFTIELPTTAPVESASPQAAPEAVPSPAGRSLF